MVEDTTADVCICSSNSLDSSVVFEGASSDISSGGFNGWVPPTPSPVGIVWDSQDAAWEEGFSHFKATPLNRRGQRPVARKHVSEDGYKLGTWQENQRQAMKRGTLSDERVAKLEAEGIIWDPQTLSWEVPYFPLTPPP